MQRTFVLCVAAAVFAGCKGDVTETSDSGKQTSGGKAAKSSQQPKSESNAQNWRQQAGYDSPEAVFSALQEASANDDFEAAVRCLDPESQEMMASLITFPLAMLATDPEKEADIKELLNKHGISLEDQSDEFPIETTEGRAAFIADVLEWLKDNAGGADEAGGPLTMAHQGSLGDVTVEGETAHATVTLPENQTEELDFVRTGGRWYLHLPGPEFSSRPATGPGGADSFGDSDFGAFGGDDEPSPPIEAVPLDQFRSAWQVTLDVQDQPANELLTKLTGELGLEMNVNPSLEQKLQQPVSIQVSEASRFEAIEEICRQIEMTPVYSTSTIGFEDGQRELPVAFEGPFLIAMTDFQTDPKTATGAISLKVYTTGLPPTVLSILNDSFGNAVQVTTVTDEADNDLGRMSGSMGGGISMDASAFERDITVGLRNLLRSVETVSKLEGVVSFSLPTKVETVKFDELKAGIQKKAGAAILTLERINGGSVTFKYTGADSDDIHVLAFNDRGDRIESFGTSSFGSGNSGQMSEDYESPPARIEARLITQQEELKYPFNFESIPVPNHGEMPEQLAELKFDGDRPLSLKYVMLTGDENFRKIKFKATNHANKGIERMAMTLSYLDADGKELDDSPSSHGGDVIPAGESANIEVSAFFMPEGTRSVEASVESIEFTDATTWQAEDE